jgi:hypothetical protein
MALHLKINRNFLSLAMARVQGAMAERNLAHVGRKVLFLYQLKYSRI